MTDHSPVRPPPFPKSWVPLRNVMETVGKKSSEQTPCLAPSSPEYDRTDILPKQRCLFCFLKPRPSCTLGSPGKTGRALGVASALVWGPCSVQGSLGSSLARAGSDDVANPATWSSKRKWPSRELAGLLTSSVWKKDVQKWTYFSEDKGVLSVAACPHERKHFSTGTFVGHGQIKSTWS